MKPSELNKIADQIYREHFGIPFPGWIEWSSRMKNIAGNCRSDGRIALNKQYYEKYGEEEIMKVLRHELAHLYCFNMVGAHTHADPLFKKTLNKLGGTELGKAMPITVYIYECPCCKKQWKFRKKVKKVLSCGECSKDGSYNSNYRIKYIGEKIYEPYDEKDQDNQ